MYLSHKEHAYLNNTALVLHVILYRVHELLFINPITPLVGYYYHFKWTQWAPEG